MRPDYLHIIVICFYDNNGGAGHVAIVEEIIDGTDTYVDRVRDPELIIILTRILKSQI